MEEDKKIGKLKAVYTGAVQAGEVEIAEIIKDGINIIENLINKNKELEEEVERRIEQKVLDYKYVDKNMLRKDIIQRDYIPKSKVREKIEEYENKLKQPTIQNINTSGYGYYLGKKEGWEELLQEGDDK